MDALTKEEAKNILSYMNLRPGEHLLIIGDNTTTFLTQPLTKHLKENKQNDYSIINIDTIGDERPLKRVPDSITQAIANANACLYAIDKRSDHETDEQVTFRRAINKDLHARGIRYGNFLSPAPHIIRSAFAVNAEKVIALTDIIGDYMRGVREARITTPLGTDAIITYDDKHDWVIASGSITNNYSGNLMPAEVYTYPASVDGKLIFDAGFAYLNKQPEFKDNPEEMLTRIQENPLAWHVRNNQILSVHSQDQKIEKLARETIYHPQKMNRSIGEHGIPTNPSITRALGNVGHDEKAYDHFAHGHGYPEKTRAPTFSPTPDHHDALMKQATLINLKTGYAIRKDGRSNQEFLHKAGF